MSPLSTPLLFALLLSLSLPTTAQLSSITCPSRLSFLTNSRSQNPCVVLSTLFGQCTGFLGQFNLTALGDKFGGYSGPTSMNQSDFLYNQCLCSMPVYNLAQACQDCQDRPAVPFGSFTTNCNSSYTGSDNFPAFNFPQPVPPTTEIPDWAALDSSGGQWQESAVYLNVSGAPEPSSLLPTFASATATGSTIPVTASGKRGGGGGLSGGTIGAIVGGVIGGLVLFAAIIFGAVILRRKYQEQQDAAAEELAKKQEKLGRGAPGSTGGGDVRPTLATDIGAWSRGVRSQESVASMTSPQRSELGASSPSDPSPFGDDQAALRGHHLLQGSGDVSAPNSPAGSVGGFNFIGRGSGQHLGPNNGDGGAAGGKPRPLKRVAVPEIQSEDEDSRPDQYPTFKNT